MLLSVMNGACQPSILEFYKGEWWSNPVCIFLQVDICNLAILVKDIRNVLLPNVRGKIADIDPAFITAAPSSSVTGHAAKSIIFHTCHVVTVATLIVPYKLSVLYSISLLNT